MKKFYLFIVAFILLGFGRLSAQCSFTGLNANYCTNSAISTLTPATAGGVFSGPGVSGSTFNPAIAGPGTFTVNYNICQATYSITSPSFSPVAVTGNTVTTFLDQSGFANSDDGTSGVLPIGFNFQFFCNTYSNFYINTNGFITFTSGQANPYTPSALPTNAIVNFIAFDWTDLIPAQGGSVTYTTIGTAPNRRLIVSFVSIPHFNGGNYGYPVTSQVMLYESTNVIEIHSASIPIPASSDNAVMGIEAANGTSFAVVTGRNATNTWAATNECYRFTPGTSCAASQTTTVSPSTITVVGNNSICVGSTATLTATGNTTYTWFPPNASNATSISVSPTITTTYSVTGTNAFGCASQGAITVTVDNTPTVTASSSSTNGGVCPGRSVTLNGGGATAYVWTGGVTNGVAFPPASSQTYTVTGTNACGSGTAAVSVSINPVPPVTASINNPTVCTGGSVTLNGGGASTYTWTGGLPNNVAFAPGASSSFTVTGSSALGCTATAVTAVTVYITPTITPIATPTAICFGATATLSSVGGTGYTWTPGVSLNTSSITVSPANSTTYTVIRTNGACTSTSTVALVVNPNPVMNASASPTAVCGGNSVTLQAVGAITYNWLPFGFTSASIVLYPNASVNYTVVGSNGNCTTAIVVPVTVNPSPTLNIAGTSSLCSGGSAQLTVSGNALTYTWMPGGSNQLSISDTPGITSQYTVTGTNASGCTATQNQLVVVYPTPNTAIVSSSPFICANQVATLSVPNSPGTTYSWNTGSTAPTLTANPAVSTGYTLTATTASSGCQSTGVYTLSVYIATFAVNSPTALCKGNTATLTAVGSAGTFNWSNNVGGNLSAASVTVSPALTTVYTVTGTTGGCASVQTVSLVVNPLPNVVATKLKPTICAYDNNTSIYATGASTYSWSTGDATATININPTISTTYTVTGTDLNGCSKTVTITQFVATCIGIEDHGQAQSLQMGIYPNPNNGSFTIKTEVAMSVSIVNTLGAVVKVVEISGSNNSNQVNLTELSKGIYFITGQANGLKVNKKIVIEK